MGPCVKTMHMNNMVNVSWQMNKDKDKGGESGLSVAKIADRSRGDIFPVASLDEYVEQARDEDDSDEEDRDFVEE
jgi:hypothetical protein